MIDLNATQAAIRAGYSVKNAASIRAQLLKKTHVSFSRASTERSWRGGITQDRVMQELASHRVSSHDNAREDFPPLSRGQAFDFDP